MSKEFYDNLIAWSETTGLKILLIIVVGWLAYFIIAKFGRVFLRSLVERHSANVRSEAGREKRVRTLSEVVSKTVGVITFLVVALMVFIELGINVTPVLTGAGIIGIAIGFGAQNLVRDFFHGIFILVEDQYSTGDVVTLAGITGTVEDFDLRRTVLRDVAGIQYHIPNGEITITGNRTKGWSGLDLKIGVGYKTDIAKLKEIIEGVGKDLKEESENQIIEAPYLAGLDEFGDSAMIMRVFGRVAPGEQWDVKREFLQKIKIAFDKEGVEIPYPHQVEIQKRS